MKTRFLPVAMFVVTWLKTKFHFRNVCRLVVRRVGGLVRWAKRRIFRQNQQLTQLQTLEFNSDRAVVLKNFD